MSAWLSSLAKLVDIRILLIGSLLPDIIDKPVGQYLFKDTFGNGRIFCHTLVFVALLAVAGVYLYKRSRSRWLLTLAPASFAHLILDEMWLAPKTLLWPAYGLNFPYADLGDWALHILRAIFTDPAVGIPELAGALVLVCFVVALARRRQVRSFLTTGRVF
jgi:hypothetical protein